MTSFVTGATGFVGCNLVRELRARGNAVKALIRPGSDTRGLDGADYERVEGDLSDPTVLRNAMKGCDWCFHAAASYHLWLRDYTPMYEANVAGTRNVLTAALDAGCKRVIYTSTVGCIGLPKSRHGRMKPSNENSSVDPHHLSGHYKRSKWEAEQVVLEMVKNGLQAVIVNPSAPVGPRDIKPTPTGKVIVDFLNRKMPAYLDSGLNWVHVRDVAIGHILAAEKGRTGERYILGNSEGNWSIKDTFSVLEEVSGIRAPRIQIPYKLALVAAYMDEGIAKLTGRAPRAPLAGVRMAKWKMFFDPSKAVRELALPQTSPKQALLDAVEWFRANGYVKG